MDYDLGRTSASTNPFGSFNSIMGFSFIASLATNPYIWDSARLLILGTLIETGRRLCYWLMERFKIRELTSLVSLFQQLTAVEYCITAQFTEGDQSYEWVLLFLVRTFACLSSQPYIIHVARRRRTFGAVHANFASTRRIPSENGVLSLRLRLMEMLITFRLTKWPNYFGGRGIGLRSRGVLARAQLPSIICREVIRRQPYISRTWFLYLVSGFPDISCLQNLHARYECSLQFRRRNTSPLQGGQ